MPTPDAASIRRALAGPQRERVADALVDWWEETYLFLSDLVTDWAAAREQSDRVDAIANSGDRLARAVEASDAEHR